ncbi:MAG: hypothetical protein KF764_19100 [Labilithrix sp.]|nr:hypothetical protein [Labilithrix sp.]
MASCSLSLVLRLPRAALGRRDVVARLAATWQARSLFAFKCDELAFARALLARRTNLWLYRTSQRAFAGDFIAVDVSSPAAASRPISVIELKRGEPVRVGLPSSVQLRNAPAALRELAGTGVVSEGASVRAITGDAAAVLALLS